jgi:hypothetical protein
VVGRWRRGTTPAADLEDLEAELVAQAWTLLKEMPPLPIARLVGHAWDRVRVARRRELRWDACRWPIELASERPAPPSCTTDRAARVVIDGFRQGRLTITAARAIWATGVAGWRSSEVAALTGCQPAAMRARCSRAVRALSA